jgi:predicted metalloprotease with PDZ domain
VRLIRISDVDLKLFDFDYDLTWAGFFLDANQRVYGRYGSRDAKDPEGRISLAGLRYAMQAALDAHRQSRLDLPPAAEGQSLRVGDYPAAQRFAANECIHCHQVNEFRRAARQAAGTWRRDEVWAYPLPENIGLTMEIDRGNHVQSVAADSPAGRAGLAVGDVLQTVNGIRTASIADIQYGLHRAPAAGQVEVTWLRHEEPHTARLQLAPDWRKTNLTWRPSLLDILPSLSLYGDDLTADEKRALGLTEKQLAFRQDQKVHRTMQAVGVEPGDVIVGIDQLPLEMTMLEFLAHIRRNYLVGDRITLNVLRGGKRVDLAMTLK